jgi:hypothetical protein
MSGTKKTIGDFDAWENPANQVDFFGETLANKDTSATEVLAAAIEDDLEVGTSTQETTEDKARAKEEKEAEDLFKDFSNDPIEDSGDDEEEEVEKKTTSKAGTTTVRSTLDFLKEKGFVDFELEEGAELTDEDAEALLEDSWEKSLDEVFEANIKALPQEVKNLIKFAKDGGDPMELLKKMAVHAASGVNKNSDITKEEVQIAVIQEELSEQGYDQEEIDLQIELLKDSGKLFLKGKKAFDRKVEKLDAAEEGQIEAQKKLVEKRKTDAREYKKNLSTHISSLTEAAGLKLSKSEKETLPSYIADPEVEMTDGRYVSQLQADLFKIMSDKDKIVALAKVIKSDFDFSAIARQKETEVSRGLKNEIQQTKAAEKNSTGVHKSSKKAVWDMLD